MSLEYPMQAITLILVMVLTFAGMLLWTKRKKRKQQKKGQ
jgi:preprotein translocase subunit YajC